MKSPVLLLIYNRPSLTAQVFEAIRTAQPSRLYVAADGPRTDTDGDYAKCEEAQRIATSIDWTCDLFTLFRGNNIGCKGGVSSGIDWFFQAEPRGIILEDDCLPHPDFFHYCDVLLERYADDERVWTVTGDNFQSGRKRGEAAYYFSRYNHCWGWASWRRAWKHYDGSLSFWPQWRGSCSWREVIRDPVEREYWRIIFDKCHEGGVDSWAYPWTASIWYHGGLTATPNVNLVRNIGFGRGASHTTAHGGKAMPEGRALGAVTHPVDVVCDEAADRYAFDQHFRGRNMRWPRKWIFWAANLSLSVLRRFGRINA